jgi:hypothetical protein
MQCPRDTKYSMGLLRWVTESVCGQCGVFNRKRPKITKQDGLCSTLLTCIREVPGLNITGDTDEFEVFHAFTQSLLTNLGIVL